MTTLDIIVFALPLALYLLWLLTRIALGRRPSRSTATTLLSIVLLVYFLVVCGTGIFWMAAQELPIFEWHYFPGYILLLLGITHVVLHWRIVSRFLKKSSPKAITQDSGRDFKSSVKILAYAVLALAAATCLFFAGGTYFSKTVTMYVGETSEEKTSEDLTNVAGFNHLPFTMTEADGKKMPVSKLYHFGTAYPALASFPGVTIKVKPSPYKEYDGKPEVDLGEVSSEGGGFIIDHANRWRSGSIHLVESSMPLSDLARILYHTAGISKTLRVGTKTFDLRTSASAGALYPTNIYVVANRVDGLKPGLYYYSMKKNALMTLRSGTFQTELAAAAGSPQLYAPAAATVLMTATIARTAFKYKDRAYRYVNMDTGHAAFNLALSAHALGYAAPLVTRFDDRLMNEFLGHRPELEPLLLLMPIGKAPKEVLSSFVLEQRFQLARATPMDKAHENYISLLHRVSSLKKTSHLQQTVGQAEHAHQQVEETDLKRIPLPEPAQGKELFASIRSRRSVRKYSDSPIRMAELSSLCVAGVGVGLPSVDPFFSMAPAVSLYVIVKHVDGLRPGVYRFIAQDRSLELLQKGDFSSLCFEGSLNQDSCGQADVLFAKTVKWNRVSQPDGDRGYRYASLKAGMIGEGLYLQASSLGLGACGVGAFYDKQMADIIGVDIEKEAVLYLTAVGK